jgi:alkylation response protein AidB-like acyl-CoA dehydrogenase
MKDDLKERIEDLKMKNATARLNIIGRLLVDNREMSLWEHDTRHLPRGAAKWRRRALEFARSEIRPRAAQADIDPHGFDPEPLLRASARKGFQTLICPNPLGSANTRAMLRGLSLQVAVTGEEFATECGGLCLLLLAHNLGIVPLLLSGHLTTYLRHFMPFYIKSRYFGSPATMAFAITEPGAGSDVEETEGGATARLCTTAKPFLDGYLLNGTKVFISGGANAEKVTVYARIENQGIESWTCFLVEKGMKGFSVGRKERKMGQRACDATELIFEDVFVPKKNIIGKLSSGWPNNRNVLNYSRPCVGAMALGHGRGAMERALEFCRRTTLGGRRLIEYQDIQHELADMMISLWGARTMIWHSCSQTRAYQSASSAAKVFASDTAFRVCNQAMEIMGDHGYMHANGVERLWRDSRLTLIYEGTNQVNRLAVIEHQWDAEIDTGILGYQSLC